MHRYCLPSWPQRCLSKVPLAPPEPRGEYPSQPFLSMRHGRQGKVKREWQGERISLDSSGRVAPFPQLDGAVEAAADEPAAVGGESDRAHRLLVPFQGPDRTPGLGL